MNRKAILVFWVVLLAGCQHDPWADGFVKAQPDEKEVVGTYVIDADSQKRDIKLPLSKEKFPVDASAQIVLSHDRKVEFVHVPEDFRGEAACSVTGNGLWRFSKNDSFTVIVANIVNREPNSPCKGEFGYELMLYGEKPPYKLHVTIGDPDSGDAIQFSKKN